MPATSSKVKVVIHARRAGTRRKSLSSPAHTKIPRDHRSQGMTGRGSRKECRGGRVARSAGRVVCSKGEVVMPARRAGTRPDSPKARPDSPIARPDSPIARQHLARKTIFVSLRLRVCACTCPLRVHCWLCALRDRTRAPERTGTLSPYPDLPRDRRCNHRAAPLLQQHHRALRCANQRIDARALSSNERDDFLLLFSCW